MNALDIPGRAKDKGEDNQSKLDHSESSMKVEWLKKRTEQILDLQGEQASVLNDVINNLGKLNERISILESKST